MDQDLHRACEDAAVAIGLEAEVKEFWYFPPTGSAPAKPIRASAAPRVTPVKLSGRAQERPFPYGTCLFRATLDAG
jgi:hypothetical protein